MEDIVYSQEVYTTVVNQLKENENYINELYAAYNILNTDEKLQVLEIIDALKILNFEYEKYIIVYERSAKVGKTKTEYQVVEGDTLPRVALKTLNNQNRWQDIFNYNNLQDIVLSPGDVLKIPED